MEFRRANFLRVIGFSRGFDELGGELGGELGCGELSGGELVSEAAPDPSQCAISESLHAASYPHVAAAAVRARAAPLKRKGDDLKVEDPKMSRGLLEEVVEKAATVLHTRGNLPVAAAGRLQCCLDADSWVILNIFPSRMMLYTFKILIINMKKDNKNNLSCHNPLGY